jgi:hypothetical protein
VIGTILIIGMPSGAISPATAAHLAGVMVAHIRTGLVPVNTTAPTVQGTTTTGSTLTATPGSWTNNPTGFTYQWERCGVTGANCTPIAGATSQTYTATAADGGATLEVTVTASNVDGQSAPAGSGPTAVSS